MRRLHVIHDRFPRDVCIGVGLSNRLDDTYNTATPVPAGFIDSILQTVLRNLLSIQAPQGLGRAKVRQRESAKIGEQQ